MPELNPMNFGTWSILEYTKLNTRKQKLTECWGKIDGKTVRVTYDQVVPRLRMVIMASREREIVNNCIMLKSIKFAFI